MTSRHLFRPNEEAPSRPRLNEDGPSLSRPKDEPPILSRPLSDNDPSQSRPSNDKDHLDRDHQNPRAWKTVSAAAAKRTRKSVSSKAE
ncbi:hypothetical protein DAPPUDRAFT_253642 [Daphnia pulex]|uniref:Uncharacterized protein n=1 Tax=Daphnia pulex TaxID=6669 RepID=E9H593_DAPPU|nr:hypothetical protein DAPPUDRAFT_253642 [Daphnia pulex]|eukprot:EFX73116.1 hypothetical protein DAPPUDRAFT_253642 [Daphnia pulex]